MSEQRTLMRTGPDGKGTYSSEFAAYCEAEFERRGNSDDTFDETHYRAAMQWVLDKLSTLTDS